ncbi:MAG: class I SAM-dependent methyltransferase [Myxococcota bacterium]
MEPAVFEHFLELHRDLPRQGPGGRAHTLAALAAVPDLPDRPRIVDLGCGPGAHTLDLLQAVAGSTAMAVDLLPQMLEELRSRAAAAGLETRVTPVQGDIGALPPEVHPASFHLVWSEGAAYSIGFDRALSQWRHLLLPGGFIAVSELAWLQDPAEAPDAARAFWREDYPAMRTIEENEAAFETAGYELSSSLVLPASAWDAYYRPLEARLETFENKYRKEESALVVARATRREIAMFREHGHAYSYVFHVGRMR